MKPPSSAEQIRLATQAQDGLELLVDTGTRAGAAALRPFVLELRRAIDSAETAEELRAELVRILREEDSDKLQEQVARARTMAHMGGMTTVLDETEG